MVESTALDPENSKIIGKLDTLWDEFVYTVAFEDA